MHAYRQTDRRWKSESKSKSKSREEKKKKGGNMMNCRKPVPSLVKKLLPYLATCTVLGDTYYYICKYMYM